jgi:hypothetical protein
MRKPRSDSKLLNLTEEQKDEILDLMETGQSYKDLSGAIEKEFGVRSSPAALSYFYSQEKAKRVVKQRLQSLSVAHEISEEAKKRPSLFDAAMIERISQLAFELSIAPKADPDVVKQFFYMVLKARDQEIQSRKLTLLEEKANQADQAKKTLGDGKLTPEQKQTRLKQIFGAA